MDLTSTRLIATALRFDINHATLQLEPMIRTVHWREPLEHEHD